VLREQRHQLYWQSKIDGPTEGVPGSNGGSEIVRFSAEGGFSRFLLFAMGGNGAFEREREREGDTDRQTDREVQCLPVAT
jgi:hypothetical protein